jgi:hypothetical protein
MSGHCPKSNITTIGNGPSLSVGLCPKMLHATSLLSGSENRSTATLGDEPSLSIGINSFQEKETNRNCNHQSNNELTPREKDLQNLVEDLKDYKATRKLNSYASIQRRRSTSEISSIDESVDGNETFSKFEAENGNRIDLFDFEDREADHEEIPNDAVADRQQNADVIFHDPRGPGFDVAVARPVEQNIQNIQQRISDSFWKVFAIVFLICATVLAAVFLTKGSNSTPIENKVREDLDKPNDLENEPNRNITVPKNDVNEISKEVDETRAGQDNLEVVANQANHSPAESTSATNRKGNYFFKLFQGLVGKLFKHKKLLILIILAAMLVFLWKQYALGAKHQDATKFLIKNEEPFAKVLVKNEHSYAKILTKNEESFAKVLKKSEGSFGNTTMRNSIQAAFKSFRTCKPKPRTILHVRKAAIKSRLPKVPLQLLLFVNLLLGLMFLYVAEFRDWFVNFLSPMIMWFVLDLDWWTKPLILPVTLVIILGIFLKVYIFKHGTDKHQNWKRAFKIAIIMLFKVYFDNNVLPNLQRLLTK